MECTSKIVKEQLCMHIIHTVLSNIKLPKNKGKKLYKGAVSQCLAECNAQPLCGGFWVDGGPAIGFTTTSTTTTSTTTTTTHITYSAFVSMKKKNCSEVTRPDTRQTKLNASWQDQWCRRLFGWCNVNAKSVIVDKRENSSDGGLEWRKNGRKCTRRETLVIYPWEFLLLPFFFFVWNHR